jgi:hypothetical protein
MPWRADGREWRHDLPMLEPPLAHTAERCAILRLAIGIQASQVADGQGGALTFQSADAPPAG